MASTAAAPGRFSTTTGCPHCLASRSASMRPVISAPEPGPSETMNLTGRLGHDCAMAASGSSAARTASSNFFIGFDPPLRIVDGDFHQVQVRIANVDRADRPLRAGLADRAFDDPDPCLVEALDDLLQGHAGDEAQVQRAWHGDVGARGELLPPLVQVDLLAAELEREALLGRGLEAHQVHAEHHAVEADAGVLVAGGEDDVVDALDHVFFSRRSGLYSSTVSPRWLTTRLAKRTRPRSPLDARRCSSTSHSTWIVSPTTVGALTSSVALRKASPVSCMVGSSRPSAKE